MKNETIDYIQKFVENYQAKPDITTQWGVPIVGFASARDTLFPQLRSVASPTHAVPQDFLPNAKTVVAYFLPFKKEVTRTNIKGTHSSQEWGLAYIETNEMIRQLNLSLKEWFDAQGHDSHTIPATHNWDEEKLISDWSHRHIAFMAGIGNFGLNNMLITDQGCCGRVGSFISSAEIEPDARYQGETCLYKYDGTCKKCTERCVNEALFVGTFDRFKCYEMLLKNEKNSRAIGYADVCGKCLVGTPCSHINPVARKIQAKKNSIEKQMDKLPS